MIYRQSIILLSSILLLTIANAQVDDIFLLPTLDRGCQKSLAQQSILSRQWIPAKNYDVLEYSLLLDWRNPLSRDGTAAEDRTYAGRTTMKVILLEDQPSQLRIDAASMEIDSVYINNHRYPQIIGPVEESFILELSTIFDPLPAKGDTVQITIFYRYTGTENLGFYLYPKGMIVGIRNGDTVRVQERIAYTMSEPEDAHYWFPCNDVPDDKAIATIAIRVPRGFITASNGIVIDTIVHPDNSITVVWQHRYPIPPYLMVANASKFFFWSEWYHRLSDPTDSIEIQYYVWEADYHGTAAGDYNAPVAFRNVLAMMRGFEKQLGPYPFEKYGMVAVQPYRYGGMEHQTMTTINRVWLRGQDPGIAHELAHQWFGNKVTCKTWADLWLNEGGATYGEALWEEERNGWSGYHQRLLRHRSAYLNGYNTIPVYNPPPAALFNYATTYAKAGWIYHMLRQLVGDSLFFAAIQWYLDKFAYGNASTDDFKQAFKDIITNPPVDFDTFFDQWVHQAGHPQYQVIVAIDSLDRQDVTVTIHQVQVGPNIPSVFVMPIDLVFISPDGQMQRQTVLNTERQQQFHFTLPFAVSEVLLDPEDKILCEKNLIVTSVMNSVTSRSAVQINYLAQWQLLDITLPQPVAGPITLQLFDTIGRKIGEYSVPNNGSQQRSVELPHPLPFGWYLCVLTTPSSQWSIPLVITP